MFRIILLFPALLALAQPVAAASSDWHQTRGGAVRLVTSGLSDEAGRLRGALQIRLEPGWKTYWRDPGTTGIPPQIEVSGTEFKGTELFFPAPQRFEDPYGDWAGYDQSVTLPVIFETVSAGTAPLVEADIFLGLCETICIPVQASFLFDASNGFDATQDALLVEGAFASLPGEPQPDFQLASVDMQAGHLRLQAMLPEGAGKPELFLSLQDGGQVALPDLVESRPGQAVFNARLIAAPQQDTELHYTLVTGDRAVHGTIPLSSGIPLNSSP